MTYYILIIAFCALFAFFAWRRFDYAIIALYALLPSYLIRFKIGPLPSTLLEVMICVIISVWIVKKIKNKPQNSANYAPFSDIFQQNKSIYIAISLFILGATISIFTSIDLRAALGEWKAFYVEPVIVFLILIDTLTARGSFDSTHFARSAQDDAKKPIKTDSNNDRNNLTMNQFNIETLINYILYGLILCGLVTSILAIYQHFTGWMVPYSFWANRNTYRVTAWYGFPNGVGLFLAPLFPLTLHIIKKEWNKTIKLQIKILSLIFNFKFLISTLFIPCSVMAIIYAKSTGALVGIFAGISALLLCNKKTRWPIIIFGVTAFTSIFALPNINPIRNELLAQDRSGQLRTDMWAETSAYLMIHPITGSGLANYSEKIAPYRIDKSIEVFHHPHNLLLTIWVSTGLIGLIGFVWIIVWFYRVSFSEIRKTNRSNFQPEAGRPMVKTVKQFNNKTIIPFLLSAMTVYLTTGLVDSPYIKNDMSILFWLLPALLIVTLNNKKCNCEETRTKVYQ